MVHVFVGTDNAISIKSIWGLGHVVGRARISGSIHAAVFDIYMMNECTLCCNEYPISIIDHNVLPCLFGWCGMEFGFTITNRGYSVMFVLVAKFLQTLTVSLVHARGYLGACGNCASSTTTMKTQIERVLKEKFGDAIKEIRQVSNELETSITDVAVPSIIYY